MSQEWTTDFSPTLVISRIKRLHVWGAIGYTPTLGEYKMQVRVFEPTYVETVIRHMARKAYEKGDPKALPRKNDIVRVALEEYFDVDGNAVTAVTKMRVRLEGKRRRPKPEDYYKTIHEMIARGRADE